MPDADFAGTEQLRALLEPIVGNPSASAVLSDLDGTLAPIVQRPEDTSLEQEILELFSRIADRYPLAGIVSGRATHDSHEIVGLGQLTYIGNHGYETLAPGAAEPTASAALAGEADRVREFVDSGLSIPECEAAGVRLEDKGAIVALHWRGADDRASATGLAERIGAEAEAAGLQLHRGRMVLELRPPVEVDKGVGIAALLDDRPEIRNVFYGGDDDTDADAFERLGALCESGRLDSVARVGVISAESPERVGRLADLSVAETDGFRTVLELLAGD